jgi:hypothetical protein
VSLGESAETTRMGRVALGWLAGLVVFAGGATATLGAGAGCGGPTTTKSCSAYVPPAGTDLASPVVSFAKDVVPIFVQSCAFDSCHGAQHGTNQGVYLGSKDPALLDVPRIRTSIVAKPANELPAMNYVTPGDTANSYLLHKIDGDICTLHAQCMNGDCQETMPQASDLLPVATRDVVRRWIAQGAKDN